MPIELTDEGTLDTVLRCSECGEEFRYNYEPDDRACPVCGAAERSGCMCALDKATWQTAREKQYNEFIDWAIEDATSEHECARAEDSEPSEPGEDDLTTTDHETFYQYGKIVIENDRKRNDLDPSETWYLRVNGKQITIQAKTCEQAVRQYMERSQFWPNVWFISDHGNAHLIDLTEGK